MHSSSEMSPPSPEYAHCDFFQAFSGILPLVVASSCCFHLLFTPLAASLALTLLLHRPVAPQPVSQPLQALRQEASASLRLRGLPRRWHRRLLSCVPVATPRHPRHHLLHCSPRPSLRRARRCTSHDGRDRGARGDPTDPTHRLLLFFRRRHDPHRRHVIRRR